MIKHYNLTESDVSAKPYEAEALYYCIDSKNIYFDSPTEGERIKMSSDTIILATEGERKSLLAPIAGKVYIVLNSACMYIYSDGKWISLSQTEFEIPNVQVSAGRTATVTDHRILAGLHARFIPDPSVADLVNWSRVTCADGSAYININPNTYNFFGRLLVGGGGLIEFCLNDTTMSFRSFYAEIGMTWADWINSYYSDSDYYSDGDAFRIDETNNCVLYAGGNLCTKCGDNNTIVHSDDKILSIQELPTGYWLSDISFYE